jgi:hypothetical protein
VPPLQIVVSDASVILDLAKTRLIEATLALSFDFVIPDVILAQELVDLGAYPLSFELLRNTLGGDPLGQNDDLSARLVLFHAAMRLSDLVKGKGPADLDVQRTRGDLLNEFLKRRQHEIFRFPGISGQADRSRDCVHRAEIVERPSVADHPRHANDAALFGAA